MIEDGGHINFPPNPCNQVKLIVFLQNCLYIMQHNHLKKNFAN
jgi:hypothetical protein